MNSARAIGDAWAMLYVGCGLVIASTIQYLAGVVVINDRFFVNWVTRTERPKKFWLILSVEVATGLGLATLALYRLGVNKLI
jgi:hypothetical protein